MIHRNLDKLLKFYNLSTQKLSLISGVDNSILKGILNEYHDPKLSTLILICQALNIKFEDLLGDPEDYKDYKERISQNFMRKRVSVPHRTLLYLFEEDKFPHL